MPTFIYRLALTDGKRPPDLTPDQREVVSAHFARLEALFDEGVVSFVGRSTDDEPATFGLVVFEAESEDAAYFIAAEDPAVQHGIMTAEVSPFEVFFSRASQQ
jgi:uncharacterized protein YciI